MKKNLYLSQLLVVLMLLVMVACQKTTEEVPQQTIDGLKITKSLISENEQTDSRISFIYKVKDKEQYLKMEALTLNGNLTSTLFFKEHDSNWEAISKFNTDIAQPNYKEGVNKTIVQLAASVKEKNDAEKVKFIEQILDQIPEPLLNALGENKYGTATALSVFYHLGVFKTAKRAYEMNSEDCHCGSFQSYLQGDAPFFCAEDKLVSAEELNNLILNNIDKRIFADKAFTAQKTLAYISNHSNRLISVNEVDQILKEEFNEFWNQRLSAEDRQSIIEEHGLEEQASSRIGVNCWMYGVVWGSDCGCCGNYSGFCWYCNLACFIHDHTCTNCTPSWYCLPGCVPGGC